MNKACKKKNTSTAKKAPKDLLEAPNLFLTNRNKLFKNQYEIIHGHHTSQV